MSANFVLVGIGATALIDVWAFLRRRLLNVALPDYALVGRWLAYFTRGKFQHDSIKKAAPIRAELAVGWISHYLLGIAFAALLPFVGGPTWFERPTLLPALSIGIATVLVPFLVMQPGMGSGIAASRTPNPVAARIHSVITHTIFGIGLYAAALLVKLL